jgi:hypothetical protein
MLLQSTIAKTALMIENEMFRGLHTELTGRGQLHMSRRRAPMSTGDVGRNGIPSAAQLGELIELVGAVDTIMQAPDHPSIRP